MAIADCNTTVDSTNRELLEHGNQGFPVACYHDDLGKAPVIWHWHEEFEAVVISEGSCVVTAGKERFILRKGEGFFVNSGILHGCWDLENSHCRFHSLVFHPRLVGGSLDSVFYQDYINPLIHNSGLEAMPLKPEVRWQKQILDAIEQAWQDCAAEQWGYVFRVRSALSDLVLGLRKNIPIEEKVEIKSQREEARMKTMLRFIHEHWAEELTTAEIAASAAISESECLRCFRARIGTPPIRYVRQYRIQRAVQLLESTELRMGEIALRCGFQDVSYFTKIFRETKGCAPAAYRRREKCKKDLKKG